MRFDVLVVGGGLAGATVSRILAEHGKKVLVIEKNKHVGGHCFDYLDENGINIHAYGPHIFHTNKRYIWRFVNRFTEFYYYQHRVLSYVDGRFFTFPINRDTIVQMLGVELSIDEVKEFLDKEVKKSKFNNPPKNFRDVIVSQIGERLYEMFFKNYTIKQWGRRPEELSPEIARRIPLRFNRDDRYYSDKFQGIPKHGFTKMIENMLDHKNIVLMLGIDYFEIKDLVKADLIVYTGELDKFFDYMFGKLEYRSLQFDLKVFDKEYYQPVSVVNYPNDYEWTRITEYKHFTGVKSDKTTVVFEYPKENGEPYYVVLTEENLQKRAKYMNEVEKLEKTGNYLFIGRLAEYKYYNMDQVIESAVLKLKFKN